MANKTHAVPRPNVPRISHVWLLIWIKLSEKGIPLLKGSHLRNPGNQPSWRRHTMVDGLFRRYRCRSSQIPLQGLGTVSGMRYDIQSLMTKHLPFLIPYYSRASVQRDDQRTTERVKRGINLNTLGGEIKITPSLELV